MRFAFWLAARLGYYNVDEMLATAPAGTLDRWRRYAAKEPWGDDWLQMSVATTSIINVIQSVAAGMGGQKLKDNQLLDPDFYVPTKKHKLNKNKLTRPVEMGMALRALTGV